ncbi:MAG TPA: FtsX-like permease family protein [Mycobacteriales bacterium]|nr:FtsX-like permease family protein [Mycobacteriales bacterium]
MAVLPGWRVALRVATRDALRHKGRSILILAMVGLPVLGMSTADVLARTLQLSRQDVVTRQIGQADAELTLRQQATVPGAAGAGRTAAGTGATAGPSAAQLQALLPAGTRVVAQRSGQVVMSQGAGVATVETRELDQADPIFDGMYARRTGRLPGRSDEVTLSAALAHRLRAHPGDRIALVDPARTYTVVGTAVAPSSLQADFVLGLPGAFARSATVPAGAVKAGEFAPTYLVTKPPGLSDGQLVAAAAEHGVTARTRAEYLHPRASGDGKTTQTFAVGVVVVGLGILQVVLLAGAAFAVGARRQVRDLALLAAAGADRRQLRAVVLSSGAVLGAVAGVVGVALGVPLAALLIGPFEQYGQTLAGPFDLRPAELALGVAIGVVAGLLAAALPARTASRQDVVLALTGRRGIRGTPKRLTAGGLAAVVAGALIAAKGATPPASATVLLVGASVAELGFLACAPALVGAAARAARFLPVSVRLALRDASRHRARTGPAVGAVMAALAGAIAIATYTASNTAHQRSLYEPSARTGQAVLYENGTSLDTALTGKVAAALHASAAVPLVEADRDCGRSPLEPAGGPVGCTSVSVLLAGSDGLRPGAADGYGTVLVGDASTLRALLGHPDREAENALAAGKVVSLTRHGVQQGTAVLTADGDRLGPAFPAVFADPGLRRLPTSYPSAVISASTAHALGLRTSNRGVLLDLPRMPSRDDEARAQSSLLGTDTGLVVERGYHGRGDAVQLALVAVAGVVTLAATAISTGLAAAEGQADLATLAAVGAAPRERRRLAMCQAAVVSLLGAGLGVLAGLVPAIAVVHARPELPLTLPWLVIGLSVAALPVLAALLAGAFSRSRLPMVARMT